MKRYIYISFFNEKLKRLYSDSQSSENMYCILREKKKENVHPSNASLYGEKTNAIQWCGASALLAGSRVWHEEISV
jgi:hypothetical protein